MITPTLRDGVDWLRHIDNPANEDRWSDARGIADRVGRARRGMTPSLERLEREGWIESKSQGEAPSFRSDAPPRLWRIRQDVLDRARALIESGSLAR